MSQSSVMSESVVTDQTVPPSRPPSESLHLELSPTDALNALTSIHSAIVLDDTPISIEYPPYPGLQGNAFAKPSAATLARYAPKPVDVENAVPTTSSSNVDDTLDTTIVDSITASAVSPSNSTVNSGSTLIFPSSMLNKPQSLPISVQPIHSAPRTSSSSSYTIPNPVRIQLLEEENRLLRAEVEDGGHKREAYKSQLYTLEKHLLDLREENRTLNERLEKTKNILEDRRFAEKEQKRETETVYDSLRVELNQKEQTLNSTLQQLYALEDAMYQERQQFHAQRNKDHSTLEQERLYRVQVENEMKKQVRFLAGERNEALQQVQFLTEDLNVARKQIERIHLEKQQILERLYQDSRLNKNQPHECLSAEATLLQVQKSEIESLSERFTQQQQEYTARLEKTRKEAVEKEIIINEQRSKQEELKHALKKCMEAMDVQKEEMEHELKKMKREIGLKSQGHQEASDSTLQTQQTHQLQPPSQPSQPQPSHSSHLAHQAQLQPQFTPSIQTNGASTPSQPQPVAHGYPIPINQESFSQHVSTQPIYIVPAQQVPSVQLTDPHSFGLQQQQQQQIPQQNQAQAASVASVPTVTAPSDSHRSVVMLSPAHRAVDQSSVRSSLAFASPGKDAAPNAPIAFAQLSSQQALIHTQMLQQQEVAELEKRRLKREERKAALDREQRQLQMEEDAYATQLAQGKSAVVNVSTPIDYSTVPLVPSLNLSKVKGWIGSASTETLTAAASAAQPATQTPIVIGAAPITPTIIEEPVAATTAPPVVVEATKPVQTAVGGSNLPRITFDFSWMDEEVPSFQLHKQVHLGGNGAPPISTTSLLENAQSLHIKPPTFEEQHDLKMRQALEHAIREVQKDRIGRMERDMIVTPLAQAAVTVESEGEDEIEVGDYGEDDDDSKSGVKNIKSSRIRQAAVNQLKKRVSVATAALEKKQSKVLSSVKARADKENRLSGSNRTTSAVSTPLYKPAPAIVSAANSLPSLKRGDSSIAAAAHLPKLDLPIFHTIPRVNLVTKEIEDEKRERNNNAKVQQNSQPSSAASSARSTTSAASSNASKRESSAVRQVKNVSASLKKAPKPVKPILSKEYA